jgi:predicted Zn-dependent peptidase
MVKVLQILGVVAILLGCAPGPVEFRLDVKEFQLDNGLTILLHENHTTPMITYYTFFKVGARNERPGITGISHFFEHMMFNGAKRYGPKMFDIMLERNGGYSNAYTNRDVTAYYEEFSSDILEQVIDLESDRMANLALEQEMLDSEIGVVKEERMMSVDNSNTGLIWEKLFSTAFTMHSYQWPVVGWMDDLNSITRDDCVDYFKTYYAPNNAVLVISGDFETEKALRLLKQYYDDIPSGPLPPEVPRNEPPQTEPRREIIERQAQHCHIMKGYHVGDKNSPDRFAMEIIQFLITTGESCRMNQALVNDLELSLGLYGGFSWGFDPSLFYFYIAATPGKDPHIVEQAFDSVLTDFVNNGPTAQELERAKNGLTANFYKNYKTNNGTAHEIAYYQTKFGDWKAMYDFVDNIKSVTADEVKLVASRYFNANNSTTITLIPEGGAR